MQVSVDGFIEGPNKEVDWIMVDDEEEWREINEVLDSVDALILGGGMYPGYEQALAWPLDQSSRGDN